MVGEDIYKPKGAREDILGALKAGLIRGGSLKRVMMTIYNAGYEKGDIEEAAAALQQSSPFQEFFGTKSLVAKPKPIEPIPLVTSPKPVKVESKLIQQLPPLKQQPKVIQQYKKVSDYGRQKSKIVLIILIFSLIMIVGILIGLFLFKSELIELLNNAFN